MLIVIIIILVLIGILIWKNEKVKEWLDDFFDEPPYGF